MRSKGYGTTELVPFPKTRSESYGTTELVPFPKRVPRVTARLNSYPSQNALQSEFFRNF